ncbi:MAG: DedA family protein [Nodosilinea sp.]
MLDWITHWIQTLDYWGIFGLMVLEHLFPPIPSELIMPLAGFTSSVSPNLSLGGVIAAGTLGSVVGTLGWYLLGRLVNPAHILAWAERYGRWLALSPQDIEKAIAFFNQRGGGWVVGAGRMVPGIRTYVSVPAGLSQMSFLPYLLYTTLGSTLWTATLASAGFFLGNRFEQVQTVIAPISKGVLLTLAIGSVVWLLRRLLRRHP